MIDLFLKPDAQESLPPRLSISTTDATLLHNLKSALYRLDRRLAEAVLAAQSVYGLDAVRDPYRGLYISAEEVARLLQREPVEPVLSSAEVGSKRRNPVYRGASPGWGAGCASRRRI